MSELENSFCKFSPCIAMFMPCMPPPPPPPLFSLGCVSRTAGQPTDTWPTSGAETEQQRAEGGSHRGVRFPLLTARCVCHIRLSPNTTLLRKYNFPVYVLSWYWSGSHPMSSTCTVYWAQQSDECRSDSQTSVQWVSHGEAFSPYGGALTEARCLYVWGHLVHSVGSLKLPLLCNN